MTARSISVPLLLIGLAITLVACSDNTSIDSQGDVPAVERDTAIDFSLDLDNDPKPDATRDVSADTNVDIGEDAAQDSPLEVIEDTGSDSGANVIEDTGTDAGTDVVEDAPQDVPSEPDVADTADTDVAEIDDTIDEEPVDPTAITFIVRNSTSEKVYLNGWTLLTGLVDVERTTGAAWISTRLWPPFCTLACDGITAPEMCCIACMPAPTVKVLMPGEEQTSTWDGENIFVIDNDYCECGCYRPADVPAMAYRAKGCVYDTMDCWGDVCTPDESGMIFGANTTGDPSCETVTFDVPYDRGTVLIEFE